MSKEKYTHIAVIVDRSGSMSLIREDMCGGFQSFVETQREVEGEATVTLAQFDDRYELLYEMEDIKDIPEFNLKPRGMTALLDGMGKTINTVVAKIDSMDEAERPEKCVFVVITDGDENASQEYSRDQVFELIAELQESEEGTKYDFVFIGANQDAIKAGASFGVRAGASMTYTASSKGTKAMFDGLTKSMTSYRCASKSADYSFIDKDPIELEDTLDTDDLTE